jgi:peptidoglycan hydrolase-like protein with peptidoglycan-binding domain
MIKNIISKTWFRLPLGIGLTLVAVFFVSTSSAKAATLDRQLELGMSGSDVSAVQTFLAQDKTLYPQGLVTGYFGFLTKAAVSNFQTRNGIDPVGRIGPQSLPVFNAQMIGIINTSGTNAPIIYNVSVGATTNAATVSWATNEIARGLVYYSNVPLTTYENVNSVDVSGFTAATDSSLRSSQSVYINGLQTNTTYYYLIYVTDQNGNVSVTWPATFHTNF